MQLIKASLMEQGSFDSAVEGCQCVFFVIIKKEDFSFFQYIYIYHREIIPVIGLFMLYTREINYCLSE